MSTAEPSDPGAAREPVFDPVLHDLHVAQATAAMPGPGYLTVLQWIHEIVRPASYVEIGVWRGDSLRAASPETLSIGVDPNPEITGDLPGRPRLFPLSSDDFFALYDLSRVLRTPHFSLAFIDGLHLFEQALRDFIHLERWAGPDSVIMIHDCVPLNRITAERVRTTCFYSGDVWKLALCLKEHRPDLKLGIVRTGPTGLCLVTCLDPRSDVLARLPADQIVRYVERPFDEGVAQSEQFPEMIQNSYETIRAWLADAGISETTDRADAAALGQRPLRQ